MLGHDFFMGDLVQVYLITSFGDLINMKNSALSFL